MVGVAFSSSVQANELTLKQFERSNVLGTSFEMSIAAPAIQAELAQNEVLNEIKRLEMVFSTYNADSEVSQLNQLGKPLASGPSKDLVAVVELCRQWQRILPKSFSCRLGNVIKMWQSYENDQQRPERAGIRAKARIAQLSEYSVDDLVAQKPNTEFTWDFGGIAKGYILDQAMKVAKTKASKATAIKIDIGGDSVYWQKAGSNKADWLIGLAAPKQIDDSKETLIGTLTLANGAIAYSGHKSRARKIGRREYSHILAPRDGWPTHNPVTAIVKAPDATSADALATALAGSEISASLDWLKKHKQYAALLIDADGRQYASENWYQNYVEKNSTAAQDYQAKISFSLPKLNVVDYRKPYVAIWVADQKGKVVKNLLILGQSERWMQENRAWWRKQGRKTPQLLDGFARPTRRPGQYDIVWNGRDDFGQQLSAGKYRLYAEAAREHGGHEKISLDFELGQTKQIISKKGKEEIGALTFKSSASKESS